MLEMTCTHKAEWSQTTDRKANGIVVIHQEQYQSVLTSGETLEVLLSPELFLLSEYIVHIL